MITNRYTLPIDAKDFNTLVQSFRNHLVTAYGGDLSELNEHELLSYLIDNVGLIGDAFFRGSERSAGESNLATAVEPQSILDIVYSTYGYVPKSAQAAKFWIQLVASSSVGFVLNKGLRLRTNPVDGSIPVEFEVAETVVKPTGVSSVTFIVQHGATTAQTHISTGEASQSFLLNAKAVDTTTIVVKVNGETWTQVQNWSSSYPTSKHYRIRVTEPLPGERRYWVLFGDGLLGVKPIVGSNISIQYLAGVGVTGNVALNSISRFVTPVVDASGQKVSASIANTSQIQRGLDAESLDVTRIKAPRSLSLHGAVVSLNDYESASLILGASRAKAYSHLENPAIDPGLVVVYIAFDLTQPPSFVELETLATNLNALYKANGATRLACVPMEFYTETRDVEIRTNGVLPESVYVEAFNVTTQFFSLSSVRGPVPKFVIDIGTPINMSNYVSALEEIDGVDHVNMDLSPIEPGPYQLPRVLINLSVVAVSGG